MFAANNSTTLTVNTSGAPVQIPLKGVIKSSVASNIKLTASVNSAQRSLNFTVDDPQRLEVTANGFVISNGNIVYIELGGNGDPVMPTLAAKLVSNTGSALSGSATWSLGITFTAQDGVPYHTDTFTPSSDGTLPADQTWNISTGTVVGGTATIQVNYGSWSGSRSFTIYGDNNFPTIAQAQSYISSVQGQWWFLNYIASWETSVGCGSGSYHQFNLTGLPCWGMPHGFGILQIDPPDGTSYPVRGVLWNWKTNTLASIEKLNTKNTYDSSPSTNENWGAEHFWSRPVDPFGGGQLQQWLQWNMDNPNSQVGPPSGPDANPGPDCPFGLNMDGTVPAGYQSWRDAVLIKMYNGAANNYISWNNADPQNQFWAFNTSGPSGNYVRNVCTQ